MHLVISNRVIKVGFSLNAAHIELGEDTRVKIRLSNARQAQRFIALLEITYNAQSDPNVVSTVEFGRITLGARASSRNRAANWMNLDITKPGWQVPSILLVPHERTQVVTALKGFFSLK